MTRRPNNPTTRGDPGNGTRTDRVRFALRNRIAVVVLALLTLLIPMQTGWSQGAVSVQINAINNFLIEMPPTLVISTATPGEQPEPATATTSWGFTTNGNVNRSLTADLDVAPPSGLTITMDLGVPTTSVAPGGGTVGSASVGSFTNATYTNVTLWTGAKRALALGDVDWTATATIEVSDADDYTGTLTLTFQ